MADTIEKKLDQVMSAIEEMKKDFNDRLDNIESRIEEKYKQLEKNANKITNKKN